MSESTQRLRGLIQVIDKRGQDTGSDVQRAYVVTQGKPFQPHFSDPRRDAVPDGPQVASVSVTYSNDGTLKKSLTRSPSGALYVAADEPDLKR